MEEREPLPANFKELASRMGDRITVFEALFQDSIRYYDSLLCQDARSSPGVEQHFLERFRLLLEQERFLQPANLREALIKLTYGYYMLQKSGARR